MHEEPTFYELAEQLDRLIQAEAPASEQVAEVLRLVSDGALERYFFRHLAASRNTRWFEPLRQHHFFDAAPEPVWDGNTVAYPPWPALAYLVAVAPLIPEPVAEVARNLNARDPFMLLDVVRVAQTLPPQTAAEMVPAIVRWAQQGMKIETSMTSLARFLAQAGQWEAALVLVGLILTPEEEQVADEARQSAFFMPRATARAEEYALRAFVEHELAFFLGQRPLEILQIVQERLEAALRIETREGGDASRGWRPAIESHEQNLGGELKDLLVEAAVQALSVVADSAPVEGRAILEEYLEHRFSIFQRLAIHTIRLRADLWPDLLERLFMDPRFVEDLNIHHEYWLLIRDSLGLIGNSAREGFIERLFGRLPSEERRGEATYRSSRYWILKQLWAVDPDLLREDQRSVVQQLVAEYGPPPNPDFLSYSFTSSGWARPKSPDDLTRLCAEAILAELRKPLPFSGFDEPSQEGLAGALKEAVTAQPERFVALAPAFIAEDIPPIHTHYIVWGFHEAWKAGRPFDWEPVLTLCELVSRTVPPMVTDAEPSDMSPGYWDRTYASARSAVTDLLHGGTARDDRAIPPELLGRVRGILLALSDDPNPSPEYEQRYGSGYPHRWLDVSLNVTRAKAVEALLQYALHLARLHDSAELEAVSVPRLRWEAEVKAKVTERLDKQVDPSLAVHSLFGRYLPNLHHLDQGWWLEHLDDIFPRQPELSDYWEAAWEGYLFQGNLYQTLYGALRPYYRYALEQIALGPEGRAGSEFARGRLARHMAFLYWHGVETLEQGSLLRTFFDVAPDGLRAAFVQGIETSLCELTSDASAPEWQRAKALWQLRLEIAKDTFERGGEVAHFTQEIGAYVGWVPHIPVSELRDMYAMIEVGTMASDEWKTVEALEFLSSQLPEHIGFVASLLEKFVERVQRPWFLATKEGTVHKILECAMSSGNSEARASAVRVINTLGQRGDERYRSLLKEASRASLERGVV